MTTDDTTPGADRARTENDTVPLGATPLDAENARDDGTAPYAWPPAAGTATATETRPRRKVLAIVGVAAAGLLLLGGSFAGGVALGAGIDGPGFDSARVSGELPDGETDAEGGGPGRDGGMHDHPAPGERGPDAGTTPEDPAPSDAPTPAAPEPTDQPES